MSKAIFASAILGALLLTVANSQDDQLDRCERAGEEGGKLAWRAACAVLTTSCPPLSEPATEEEQARFQRAATGDLAGGIPEQLVVQIKRDSCVTLFQTKCRSTASAFVFAGANNPVCADILTRGPLSVDGCENHEAAVKIFEGALDVCDQVPEVAQQSSDDGGEPARVATPSTPSFDDPCECTSDGMSGQVQTEQSGCGMHIMNNPRQFCYVVGGSECTDGNPSRLFDGAYWRDC